jgi:polyhydroxybutyrate depolymerase
MTASLLPSFALACGMLVSANFYAATAQPLPFPPKGSVSTAEFHAFTFGGERHEFLMQPIRDGHRHPVVVLLHGGDSSARTVWTETSLPTLGARFGFVVVAPNATSHAHWNDGRGTVGEGAASAADDVGSLRVIIAELVAHDDVDARAVFMAGVSNGGMMTMRFACEEGRLLRAAASVVADLPASVAKKCYDPTPLPWLAINADRDPRVPFAGLSAGKPINGRPQAGLESADQTFAFFADRARCSKKLYVEQVPDRDSTDGSTVEKRMRSGCFGVTTSTQYVLHGAGHNVPGLPITGQRLRELGPANEDVDAGTVIWEHFRQTLPAAAFFSARG